MSFLLILGKQGKKLLMSFSGLPMKRRSYLHCLSGYFSLKNNIGSVKKTNEVNIGSRFFV